MKDLNDILYGRDFEWDDYGLLLPPGTKDDVVVYEKHGDYPEPLLFVRREEQESERCISLSRQFGVAVFNDGRVLRTEGGRVRELTGIERIRARAELRNILGPEIANAAGIEPE